MRKASIERQREDRFNGMFAAGVLTGVFVACSGGGEFTSQPPDKNPDASIESGAGGGTGGNGGTGSGAVGSVSGGSANGGSANGGVGGKPLPVDAGKDGSDGGDLPPAACIRDEDCAPFICRGTPTCREGVCAPGDPCESPDGGSCINECVRTVAGASCVVLGRDADRDGHRDARCQANPGDDCDDSQPAVHAAAAELCDGLDNDCNQKADVFDGLPAAGTNRLITTLANTAQLGLVMRTSGYALLTIEMADFYAGAGNPTDVRLLSFAGDTEKSIRISGSLNMADPAIAAKGNELAVFGFRNTGTTNVLTMTRWIDADGVLQPEVPIDTMMTNAQVWGRAMATFPNGQMMLVWAELPTTTPSPAGSIAFSMLTAGGAGSAAYITQLLGTTRAYRPHVAIVGTDGYGVAWAEQLPAPTDVTMQVHLTYRAGLQGGDVPIDSFRVPETFRQFQGEAIRPQVAYDGTAFTIASRGPDNTLRVSRLSTTRVSLCGPTPITGIAAWGAAGSLVSTAQGVLLTAVETNGDVVIYRVSQGPTAGTNAPCLVQRGPVLNAPTKRVASSTTFETGELKASLGDPVILAGKDNAVVVGWVERDRSAAEAAAAGVPVQNPSEPNRLVLRILGPNLCD